MSQFIQLHLLTAYPPSNLNRDDLGRPKTAVVGGTERLRISSQSLKRAWRTSDLFSTAMAGHIGIRTKRLGSELQQKMIDTGLNEKKATARANTITSQFAKLEKGTLITSQLVHYSPQEWQSALALAQILAEEDRDPTAEELGQLRQANKAVDMALFGRMLAENPKNNVDAAMQVAHAFSVNPVRVEDDYFTAVDDLNRDESAGAAHIGEGAFGSGVFYLYLCINKSQLQENLQGDADLCNRAIASLIETVAKVSPTGKQNSFASRAYTSYMLAEKGTQQPRSLSVAFLKACRDADLLSAAIEQLDVHRQNLNTVYGDCADACCHFNALSAEGSLSELCTFATS